MSPKVKENIKNMSDEALEMTYRNQELAMLLGEIKDESAKEIYDLVVSERRKRA